MIRRVTLALLLLFPALAQAQKEYGFDNSKPSGQPYLSPEETVRRMKVYPGFEVKLFAAEPLLTNPIAFTIDARGRVWAIESFEYPKRTPKGQTPRDRIVILEDTDGDGVADRRTVFAEGKDFPILPERAKAGLPAFEMASGLEIGDGGCYVGAPPYLWHLQDTKGTGKADKFEVLASGFGAQDTHETLNTFTWGPDGWLYGLHGVFTTSKVKVTENGNGIDMDAAVWRYHPGRKHFEIFAEGTSNPWGMDFNSQGDCFICCCVIPHLFHIVPGGIYIKQGNKPSHNPYAYGALREICDHTFHKESGWAHAGLLCLDQPCMPKELQSSVIFGSIHGCSIKRNVLERHGSSYIAHRADDFLVSGDKNFRPINLRWGPGGDIYVSDWHDQNPCHQANPESWDYERGRIYRIVRKEPHRSVAFRPVRKQSPVRMLWNQYAEIREAPARTDGFSRGPQGGSEIDSLAKRARMELSPATRLELISAAIALTPHFGTAPLVDALLAHAEDVEDPAIPFMLWLAVEKLLAQDPARTVKMLQERAAGNSLVIQHILPRATRRLTATGQAGDLSTSLALLSSAKDNAVRTAVLAGLAEGLRGRRVRAPFEWKQIAESLAAENDPVIKRLSQAVAASFNDDRAARRALEAAANASASNEDRTEAIRQLALLRPPEGPPLLASIIKAKNPLLVRAEAARAVAAFDQPTLAMVLVQDWQAYPQTLRAELVTTLRSRRPWAKALLEAVAQGRVPRTDLNDNTALAIRNFKDKELDALVEKVYGKFRDSPAELAALIDKLRKQVPAGTGDKGRGKLAFEKHCMQCHKFEGRGHDVGPNLDGAERSIDYLILNIVDPNRVVGTPYFTRTVILKNGRIITGILAEEDAKTLRLRRENDVVEVLAKGDIEEQSTSTKSLMPEGLANNMTVQDLRDLIKYLEAPRK